MAHRGKDGERHDWFGMSQSRPRLPYYLRSNRRLKGLDEFEAPIWKGRTVFADKPVPARGIARDTLRWLAFFAIAAAIGGAAGIWLDVRGGCMIVAAGFKIGWC